eukprot:2084328-Lingulodinium_polyedra.AAC.1
MFTLRLAGNGAMRPRTNWPDATRIGHDGQPQAITKLRCPQGPWPGWPLGRAGGQRKLKRAAPAAPVDAGVQQSLQVRLALPTELDEVG